GHLAGSRRRRRFGHVDPILVSRPGETQPLSPPSYLVAHRHLCRSPVFVQLGAAPAHWRQRAIGSPSSPALSLSRLSPARGLSARRGAASAANAAVGEPCAGYGRCTTISDRESLPVCLINSERGPTKRARRR